MSKSLQRAYRKGMFNIWAYVYKSPSLNTASPRQWLLFVEEDRPRCTEDVGPPGNEVAKLISNPIVIDICDLVSGDISDAVAGAVIVIHGVRSHMRAVVRRADSIPTLSLYVRRPLR